MDAFGKGIRFGIAALLTSVVGLGAVLVLAAFNAECWTGEGCFVDPLIPFVGLVPWAAWGCALGRRIARPSAAIGLVVPAASLVVFGLGAVLVIGVVSIVALVGFVVGSASRRSW